MRFTVRRRRKFRPAQKTFSWRWKLAAALVLAVGCCMLLEMQMKPALLAAAELRGKTLAVQSIHEVIRENIHTNLAAAPLLDVRMDQNGRVSFIQPNTQAVNQISSELAVRVQERLKKLETQKIELPFGQILATPLLAGVGPPLTVRVIPAGTVEINVLNRFEDAGINQTKYQLYLEVAAEVRIVVPLMSKSLRVTTQVPVAEYVVVGDVPGTYLELPFKE